MDSEDKVFMTIVLASIIGLTVCGVVHELTECDGKPHPEHPEQQERPDGMD